MRDVFTEKKRKKNDGKRSDAWRPIEHGCFP